MVGVIVGIGVDDTVALGVYVGVGVTFGVVVHAVSIATISSIAAITRNTFLTGTVTVLSS
jgi:hypothetical protein